MQEQKLSYEECTKQLEEITTELENGNLSMEKAMQSFERGKELAKLCYDHLDNIKGKLSEITEYIDKLSEVGEE